MNGHFDAHLCFHELFLSHPPDRVLELGALNGENTIQLLSLRSEIPGLRVTTVSDGLETDERPRDPYLDFIWGISWVEMAKMKDQSFGAVLIDTDHNYWTLKQELSHCDRLLCQPAWIILHDTVSFIRNTGKQMRFRNETIPYPLAEIEAADAAGLQMEHAIQEFLAAYPKFKLIRESLEHHGARAYRRVSS